MVRFCRVKAIYLYEDLYLLVSEGHLQIYDEPPWCQNIALTRQNLPHFTISLQVHKTRSMSRCVLLMRLATASFIRKLLYPDVFCSSVSGLILTCYIRYSAQCRLSERKSLDDCRKQLQETRSLDILAFFAIQRHCLACTASLTAEKAKKFFLVGCCLQFFTGLKVGSQACVETKGCLSVGWKMSVVLNTWNVVTNRDPATARVMGNRSERHMKHPSHLVVASDEILPRSSLARDS